jgi:hypothetical protein
VGSEMCIRDSAYTYYLFAKDNNTGCYSATGASFILNINAVIPSVNITGSNQAYYLNDNAFPLSATASAGMSLQWWSQLTGGTVLSAPVIPITAAVGVVNYYVNQIDGNGSGCTSTPRQLVTVTTKPAKPSIASNVNIVGNTISYCQNVTPTALTATLTQGATANWYTSSVGGSPLNGAPTPSTGTVTKTSYYVSQTIFGLESERVEVAVDVKQTPATPGSISGIVNPLAGELITYSIAGVQSATSYNWTLPNDWTGSSSTNTIDATVGTSNGNISVVAIIDGCSSNIQSLSVGLKPVVPNISGNTGINGNTITYCQGVTAYQLTASGSNGSTFNWYTVPFAGSANTVAPTPSTTTDGSTSYFVSQTVNGVESDRVEIVVIVKPLPAQPSSISGKSSPADNSTETYSVTYTNGVEYSWTVPTSWAIQSGTGNATITQNQVSGLSLIHI